MCCYLSIQKVIAQDIEQAPIEYLKAKPANSVQTLIDALESGQSQLKKDETFGYLPALLEALEIPVSSQTLVFSKTSLQRNRINPRTPRALYFNDEVYVGYCQHGDVVEISTADTKLGTAFYTLDQTEDHPRFKREYDHCIVCHGGTVNHNYPGHIIRSLFVDHKGEVLFSLGTTRVDHRTPFAERWGGWYVTGQHGEQYHRGNMIVPSNAEDIPTENPEGLNVLALDSRIKTSKYLSPYSDLVALMVMEHQAEGHNRLARVLLESRIALYQQRDIDRILERKSDGLNEGTRSRILGAVNSMLDYFLFCQEAPLTHEIAGTSTFTADFAQKSLRDAHQRSLRDFDLKTRLFKHPLSYLIYSPEFDQLPAETIELTYQQLGAILSGQNSAAKYKHLTPEIRTAIYEILIATKPQLPADWAQKYKPVVSPAE
jgi:hypothetical protein